MHTWQQVPPTQLKKGFLARERQRHSEPIISLQNNPEKCQRTQRVCLRTIISQWCRIIYRAMSTSTYLATSLSMFMCEIQGRMAYKIKPQTSRITSRNSCQTQSGKTEDILCILNLSSRSDYAAHKMILHRRPQPLITDYRKSRLGYSFQTMKKTRRKKNHLQLFCKLRQPQLGLESCFWARYKAKTETQRLKKTLRQMTKFRAWWLQNLLTGDNEALSL